MLTPEDVWKMRGRPLDTEDIQLLLDEVERLQKENERLHTALTVIEAYCSHPVHRRSSMMNYLAGVALSALEGGNTNG